MKVIRAYGGTAILWNQRGMWAWQVEAHRKPLVTRMLGEVPYRISFEGINSFSATRLMRDARRQAVNTLKRFSGSGRISR